MADSENQPSHDEPHRPFVASDFTVRDIPIALLTCYFLLGPATKEIDVASLPEPSATVMAKCDDPACSLVEAVEAYREGTGLALTEAVAVLRNYQASKRHGQRTESLRNKGIESND